MKFEYTGRHVEVTPALRSHVEEHFARISHLFDGGATSAHVIIEVERNRHHPERDRDLGERVGAARGRDVGRSHRHICRTKVDCVLDELLNSSARADRLVVDRHLRVLQRVVEKRL